MNYQQVLTLNYVPNLVETIINIGNRNFSDNMEIVKENNKFYIKHIDQDNLYYINENINSLKLKTILNTIIHFEQHKHKPLDSFIIRENKLTNNINQQLLQHLYLQQITDNNYFN